MYFESFWLLCWKEDWNGLYIIVHIDIAIIQSLHQSDYIGIMFRIFVKLTAYACSNIAFGFLISASIEKYDYNVKTVYFYRLHHFEFDITLQNGLKYVF